MPASKQTVILVRRCLDRLAACRRLSGDEQEEAYDEVADELRTVPEEGILEVIETAVGRSTRRRHAVVDILLPFAHLPEIQSLEADLLQDPDPKTRATAIQTIQNRSLRDFASLLNPIMQSETDSWRRRCAISAAATLRSRANVPTLLHLMHRREPESIGSLVIAAKEFATEEFRQFLAEVFAECEEDRLPVEWPEGPLADMGDPASVMCRLKAIDQASSRKSTRILAAWGLGRLGDQHAVAYLIQMLHDPWRKGPDYSFPGESLKAAQALCDLFGWKFEWNTSYVPTVIEWVNERLGRF
jgi:HEAT repeat protein